MKTCGRCKIEKDTLMFSRYSNSKDGLQKWCKDCSEQWRKENYELLCIKNKEWRKKNSELLKKKAHKNYLKNSEKIKQWQRDYREKHPEKKKLADHKTYVKYAEKKKLSALMWQAKNRIDWEGIVPIESSCGACSKPIYFNKSDKENSICFDHRHEGTEPIKGNPTDWLKKHPRNKENENLWRLCDFGTLCFKCNSGLPTINRGTHILNLVNYHFGEDIKDMLIKELNKLGGPREKLGGMK